MSHRSSPSSPMPYAVLSGESQVRNTYVTDIVVASERARRRAKAFEFYEKYERLPSHAPPPKRGTLGTGEWSQCLPCPVPLTDQAQAQGAPTTGQLYICKSWITPDDLTRLREMLRLDADSGASPTCDSKTTARRASHVAPKATLWTQPGAPWIAPVPNSALFENADWIGVPRYLGWALWGPQLTFPYGPPVLPSPPSRQSFADDEHGDVWVQPRDVPGDANGMSLGMWTRPLRFEGLMRTAPVDQLAIVQQVVGRLHRTNTYAPGGIVVADCAIGKTVLMAAIWVALPPALTATRTNTMNGSMCGEGEQKEEEGEGEGEGEKKGGAARRGEGGAARRGEGEEEEGAEKRKERGEGKRGEEGRDKITVPLRRLASEIEWPYERTYKLLVIVNKGLLLDQAAASFRRFVPRARVATFQACKPPTDFDVCVATIQSIKSRMEHIQARRPPHLARLDAERGATLGSDLPADADERGWLDQFGAVFYDEAHHDPATSFALVVSSIPAMIRIGFSATPRRNDGRTYLMRWLFGAPLVHASRPWNYFESRYIGWRCGQNLERTRTIGTGGPLPDKFAYMATLAEDIHRNIAIVCVLLDAHWQSTVDNVSVRQTSLTVRYRNQPSDERIGPSWGSTLLPPTNAWLLLRKYHSIDNMCAAELPPPNPSITAASSNATHHCPQHRFSVDGSLFHPTPHNGIPGTDNTQYPCRSSAPWAQQPRVHAEGTDCSNDDHSPALHPLSEAVAQFVMIRSPLVVSTTSRPKPKLHDSPNKANASAVVSLRPMISTPTRASAPSPLARTVAAWAQGTSSLHRSATPYEWQSIRNAYNPSLHTIPRLSMTFSDSIQHLLCLQHLAAWAITRSLSTAIVIRTSPNILAIVDAARLTEAHYAHLANYNRETQTLYAYDTLPTILPATTPQTWDAWFHSHSHSGPSYHHSRHPYNLRAHSADPQLAAAQRRRAQLAGEASTQLATTTLYESQFEWTTCYTPFAWPHPAPCSTSAASPPGHPSDVHAVGDPPIASLAPLAPPLSARAIGGTVGPSPTTMSDTPTDCASPQSRKRKRASETTHSIGAKRRVTTHWGMDPTHDPRPALPIVMTLGLFVGARALPPGLLGPKVRNVADQDLALQCDMVFTTHTMSSDGIDQARASILMNTMASRGDDVQCKGRLDRTMDGKPPPIAFEFVDTNIGFFAARAQMHAQHDIAMCRQIEYLAFQ